MNPYGYVGGSPLDYVDPEGLDIWIEGPSKNEPPGHQSINVGNPNGNYDSFSFGVNPSKPFTIALSPTIFPFLITLRGEVYQDTEHGGVIEAYKKTTYKEDAEFLNHLRSELGGSGIYGPGGQICRGYSQKEFDIAPGKIISPPSRTGVSINNSWIPKRLQFPSLTHN